MLVARRLSNDKYGREEEWVAYALKKAEQGGKI